LAIPHAMKIGAAPGGVAPSVEENSKMTAAAIAGSTPAYMSAENETDPIATTVAVDVNGPPTNVTRKPTITIVSRGDRFRACKIAIMSLARGE